MLWFRSHRRFQKQLSAYIDAELPEKDALALDGHVQSCEDCSRSLDELRLASAALQELPEVDVPRSFALSAADVARPVPPPAVRSINSGLRLTGAGLAAALAVLLVLDAGGIVGSGDGGRSTRNDTGISALAPAGANADKAMGGTDAAAEAPTVESGSADGYLATESPMPDVAGTPLESPLGGTAPAGSVDGGPASGGDEPTGTPFGAGAQPATGPSPAPAEQHPPATAGEGNGPEVSPETTTGENAFRSSAIVTPTPTGDPAEMEGEVGLNGFEQQDNGTLTTLDANADSDDGPSALLVTEIVLAALLGASIVGVVAVTYAERRHR